jgi:hypothetical protein
MVSEALVRVGNNALAFLVIFVVGVYVYARATKKPLKEVFMAINDAIGGRKDGPPR